MGADPGTHDHFWPELDGQIQNFVHGGYPFQTFLGIPGVLRRSDSPVWYPTYGHLIGTNDEELELSFCQTRLSEPK